MTLPTMIPAGNYSVPTTRSNPFQCTYNPPPVPKAYNINSYRQPLQPFCTKMSNPLQCTYCKSLCKNKVQIRDGIVPTTSPDPTYNLSIPASNLYPKHIYVEPFPVYYVERMERIPFLRGTRTRPLIRTRTYHDVGLHTKVGVK
ncbi:unnamed protein product, partial [Ectocarpus sp. 12 AP-2014]